MPNSPCCSILTKMLKILSMKSNLSTNLAYMYCVFTGNHTITVLKTSEDYKNLRNGMANVTLTVNKPVMNGKRVKLQFFLRGGYKVQCI